MDVTSLRDQRPEYFGLRLLDDPSPPLYRTALLGVLASLRLSGEIAADAARELLSTGSRLARRERRPRV